MVPLEVEGPHGAGGGPAGSDADVASEGAAAPIVALSKVALKDAVLELESTVRNAQGLSAAAALQLRQSAGRYLGLEVEIEDPAQRGLFELHVVAVEELLRRLRDQADALVAAAEAWTAPPLSVLASGLTVVGAPPEDEPRLPMLCGDLAAASRAGDASVVRLREQLQAQVFARVEARLQEHEALRAALRDRQRWAGFAASARRDVARFRKGGDSGLTALIGEPGRTPLEQASLRLAEADGHVAELDTRVMELLEGLSEKSVDSVRLPWAALVQVEAGFFLVQQSLWAGVADSIDELCLGPTAGAAAAAT